MKRLLIIAAAVLCIGGLGFFGLAVVPSGPAQSQAVETIGTQTVSFAIENMYCALCPLTVHKAIERVDGVKSVKVDFKGKEAIVVFDPAVTSTDAIAAASNNAGYPATVRS